MPTVDPSAHRHFAHDVVVRLRAAGYETYLAGGCVRDQLLGLEPKDYDVATTARPDEIRDLFGRRRTIAVGAAFGVIGVLGPLGAGQIEVATFRRDVEYTDGRHPDAVAFSSAREDAARRDFTINGLFYDPLADSVIDFVGGRADLAARVLRAIGDPHERFREDKLRLLRAVRFAAAFDFTLESNTLAAVRRMAPEVTVVSPERIAGELRRMLTGPRRAAAVRLLVDTGLAAAVLPEIVGGAADVAEALARLEPALTLLDAFAHPPFPQALAALLHACAGLDEAEALALRLRLSNKETARTCWLLEHWHALDQARSSPWSAVQPRLAAEAADDLVALLEARARAGQLDPHEAAWCRAQLARPAVELNPPPLLTGDDLVSHGVPRGPHYRTILERVRQAQLDGEVHSTAEALALADQILQRG